VPPDTVTLGNVEVPIYAQRHAYLARRIGPAVQAVIDRGQAVTADNLLAFAGDSAYDVLAALIPNLEKRMPRWQFLGYGSQAALDADEYDDTVDVSPSLPEIREAFVVAARVNGIDELAKLGKVIDPRLIRAQVNSAIANSIDSPSLPATSGGSDSTTSGATSPISTESEASPSLASAA